MKKKVFALITILLLTFTLVSCSLKEDGGFSLPQIRFRGDNFVGIRYRSSDTSFDMLLADDIYNHKFDIGCGFTIHARANEIGSRSYTSFILELLGLDKEIVVGSSNQSSIFFGGKIVRSFLHSKLATTLLRPIHFNVNLGVFIVEFHAGAINYGEFCDFSIRLSVY
jgi:hypothetical protein